MTADKLMLPLARSFGFRMTATLIQSCKTRSILSFEYGVGPFDLDRDGKLEFVEDEHFPSNLDNNAKWIQIPRVKRWSRAGGFIDVSAEYPRYYKERIIPDLERRLTVEHDPELRQTISRAVAFLKHE